jgi:hypothetical protein
VYGVSVFVPLEASVPVQPDEVALLSPEARQVVAVGDDQVMLRVDCAGTDVELNVSVGAGGTVTSGVTVNVTELAAEGPPLFVHRSVNVSVPTAAGVMVWSPLAASVPDQLPEAVQFVAVSDHEIVTDCPTRTEVALKLSVGAAGGAPEVANSTAELAAEVPAVFTQVSV